MEGGTVAGKPHGPEAAALEALLIERIARGDERALAELYDRYARILFSLIARILRDPRDAEDVLQDVFLQVWRIADRFDPARGNAYRWLVTLARSRSIDRTRSKSFSHPRRAEVSLETTETATEPLAPSQLDAVLMLERGDIVRRALASIPREQIEVMELAYFLGHTQTEIARELQIPLGTVKSRLRQGLSKLRTRLAEGTIP